MKNMINIALVTFLVFNITAQDSAYPKQFMIEKTFSGKITRVTAETHPAIYHYAQFVLDLSNSIAETAHVSELPIFIVSQQDCMRRSLQKMLANIEAAIILPEEALDKSIEDLHVMIARQIGYIKYGYMKKISACLLGTGMVSIASAIYFWPSMSDASAIEKFSMKLAGLATTATLLLFACHDDITRKVDVFVTTVQAAWIIAQSASISQELSFNQSIHESSDLHTTV